MDSVQDRIIAHLNGTATDEESREVCEWIQQSPENAREFATVSLMHGQLRSLLVGEQNVMESGALETAVSDTRVGTGQSSRIGLTLLVLAASIALFLGIYWGQDKSIPQSQQFATIQQISNVVWIKKDFKEQDRIGVQTLELESGTLQLQFDNGVDVSIEGPAKYELVSDSETKLLSGVVVATVPSGAEGFRVDTPSAQVIDLGTSFGVNVDDDGVAEVLVFDGEVEIIPDTSDKSKRILGGESVRMDAEGIVDTEFNPSRFERLWPIASGIVGSSESFSLPLWPKRLRNFSDPDSILLVRESNGFRLAEPLKVNISAAGDYSEHEQLTPIELPAGERIRSYLMHYFPNQDEGRLRAKRITGSVTFDRPVKGIVILHDELVASSRIGRIRAGELQPRSQLELGVENGDRITLSEDRRTITVELTCPNRSTDVIRVIVEGDRKRRRRNKRRNP